MGISLFQEEPDGDGPLFFFWGAGVLSTGWKAYTGVYFLVVVLFLLLHDQQSLLFSISRASS